MSDPRHDLAALVGKSTTPTAKSRLAVWLLPIAVLGGFVALFAVLFHDQWMPAPKVEVAVAIAVETENATSPPGPPAAITGRLMFQASGWIEPDPLPIKATALTDGVVDQVHILEGAAVRKGDLLATLIEIDARLDRDAMRRDLEMKRAEFDAHCTGTQIAIRRMEAEQAGLTADQADAEEAADRLARLTSLPPRAVPEGERFAALQENARRQAALAVREASIAGIAEEMNRIAYEIVALQAGLGAAEIALAKADLALERTRITAPIDGRILRLLAAPGQKKMIGMDEEDSATIAILYDPARLQVRVDVPLADAAGLGVGQRANIRCSLLPDRVFRGEVPRITGEAHLQRNTLQAKVRIEDPDEKLRPEMLCRVEFLESAVTGSTPTASRSSALAVFIPEAALLGETAWICDPETLRVSRRAIMASADSRDGLRRIDDGILPGEWVVLAPAGLKENQRVKATLRP